MCLFMFTATSKKICFQTYQEEPFQCNLEIEELIKERCLNHINHIFIYLKKFGYFTFMKKLQNVQDEVAAIFCDFL